MLEIDNWLFQNINQFAGRWEALNAVAIFFARYSGYVLVVFLFILFRKKWKIIFQAFGAAILSRLVITNLIRWIFPRVRPFVENHLTPFISQGPTEPSFPSGHAAFYFAIAAVIYFYNKKISLVFLAIAFLMGIARIFVGVHWPSDILAGAIVGILSAWLVVKLFKKCF